MNFDKNFLTICARGIHQPYQLTAVKCNLLLHWVAKRFLFLSNPILVRSTDISIFLVFDFFKQIFYIDEPHYCFSAITHPIARFFRFYRIARFYVPFIGDINNLIFQIFPFSGLGDNLYFYIAPSTILISVIYSC